MSLKLDSMKRQRIEIEERERRGRQRIERAERAQRRNVRSETCLSAVRQNAQTNTDDYRLFGFCPGIMDYSNVIRILVKEG